MKRMRVVQQNGILQSKHFPALRCKSDHEWHHVVHGRKESAPSDNTFGSPPYTRIEHERRFLVDSAADWRRSAKPYSRLFDDRYLTCGRLRLRRIEDSDTGRITWKLTKTYESDSPFAQPVVSVWLSSAEYEALRSVAGYSVSKRRYYDEQDGLVFSIDVFYGELDGLILCETESASLETLCAVRFPLYAR